MVQVIGRPTFVFQVATEATVKQMEAELEYAMRAATDYRNATTAYITWLEAQIKR